jgi:hypothetical protein
VDDQTVNQATNLFKKREKNKQNKKEITSSGTAVLQS